MGNSIIDMYIPKSMIEFANSCMVSCEFVFFSGFVFNFQRKLSNIVQTINKTLFSPMLPMAPRQQKKIDFVDCSAKKVTMLTFWSNVGFFSLRWPLQDLGMECNALGDS